MTRHPPGKNHSCVVYVVHVHNNLFFPYCTECVKVFELCVLQKQDVGKNKLEIKGGLESL